MPVLPCSIICSITCPLPTHAACVCYSSADPHYSRLLSPVVLCIATTCLSVRLSVPIRRTEGRINLKFGGNNSWCTYNREHHFQAERSKAKVTVIHWNVELVAPYCWKALKLRLDNFVGAGDHHTSGTPRHYSSTVEARTKLELAGITRSRGLKSRKTHGFGTDQIACRSPGELIGRCVCFQLSW